MKLQCFLHVSTAYCNVDKPFTPNEQVYPSCHDWRHILHALETTDPYTLGCLTNKQVYAQRKSECKVSPLIK